MSALLQQAIRDKAMDVQAAIDDMERAEPELSTKGLREARDLLRVLANILGGMNAKRAFGAPGDWGYDNSLGQGVLELLSTTNTVKS